MIRDLLSGFFLFTLTAVAAEPALPIQPSEDRPLAERFVDPPPSARILKMIHGQPDAKPQQNKLLRKLADQGFGGFVVNVAFQGYMEDETKWPAFQRGVRMAKASGMSLWLYDEYGYPSGSAGGLTLRGHPEWAARGLLVAETNVCGGSVSLPVPPGRLVSAIALPRHNGAVLLAEAQNLASSVADGRLTWQPPAGEWFVAVMTDDLIYESTHAAVSLDLKKPCINLLMKEPTARFLEVTHERYAEKLGKNLGRFFKSTFTDEPSLQNFWFRPMPYRVLPWSDTLAAVFQKRNGYDLLPVLPALVTEAGPRGSRVRYDFWDTVGDLVSENYFGQIQSWCHRHGLASGGHLLMEEHIVEHVPLYGDFFRCVRRVDAPGIDCTTSLPQQVPWYIARMISSIADLEERQVTMCEVSDHRQKYRRKGDKRPVVIVTEDEIRGTCHKLVWGGINTLNSYYTFMDLSNDQLRRLNMEIGRCSTMMAGGHQVSDIAVLYPIGSIWPAFIPAYKRATREVDAIAIQQVFDGVGSALYASNHDFTYVDAQALSDAKVRGDTLRHGDLRWRVLVLPAVDTLPLAAWEKVLAFWRKGGTVLAVGARPENSTTEWPSPRVQTIARTMFSMGEMNAAGGVAVLLPVGMIALVPKIIDGVVERDAVCDGKKSPVRITHRRIDNHDVYLAINDSDTSWSGTVTFCGEGVDEQWDPVTGRMTPLRDGRCVPLKLGAYRAMLFRAEGKVTPRRLRKTGNFAITCNPLPAIKPEVRQGQFVKSVLTGDDTVGWCAAATLAKGAVNTHLFMSFRYEQPPALDNALGIFIDTSVPEGQQTPAKLLVFIHTRDGGNYVASTGRMLNEPGEKRAYVMFNEFRPYEKTKAPLDVTQVADIRVGWGGYFGEEGEKITLTTRVPQSFNIK